MARQTKADKDRLKEARTRFKHGLDADEKQRTREEQSIRFYNGEQWPADVLAARTGQNMGQVSPSVPAGTPARPTITINLTREPVRQVLNQERQADLGISIIPADDFGNLPSPITQEEIDLREGLVRRIQRDSEANDARSWAFARANISGRGYYGVMTRYAPGKTADQELYIERFYNQQAVMLDPLHEQPDGSDGNWAFTWNEAMPWEEYKATYPRLANSAKNPIVEWSASEFRALEDDEREWFTWEQDNGRPVAVRVVNYWYVEWEGKDLAMFPDGRTEWVEELPEDATGYETRRVVERKVCFVVTDGVNILDETDWPGHYLPIVKVLGEELQPVDGQRQVDGLVWPAMDACRSANYMISKWVETVGLSPIPQWLMAEGQDEGFEAEWDNINTRTLGRVHYRTKDLEGNIVGPPGRITAQTDVAGIAGAVQLFTEMVNKVMSIPDTSLGHVDPTVKSGKLAKLLIDRGMLGTSHALDNLARSMRHEARILNDLLYPIYGQREGRIMRLLNGNAEYESVLLGQPMVSQNGMPQPAPQGQPDAKLYKLTKDVEFSVAVKVSKNFDTRREEEAELVGQLIQAEPSLMQVFGDLYFKNLDGPGAREMAKRMEVMLAPPVQQLLKGGQPADPQAQAMIAQLQQQLQEAMQLADKNKSDLMKTEMTQQAENERTSAELASKQTIELEKIALERRKLEVQLEIEMMKLGHAQAMVRGQQETKLLHQHADRLHEREMAAGAQGFEREQTSRGQSHERDMAERGHQQAVEIESMRPSPQADGTP